MLARIAPPIKDKNHRGRQECLPAVARSAQAGRSHNRTKQHTRKSVYAVRKVTNAMDQTASHPPAAKEILTGLEVESLLHVSRTTLWKLREEGRLPYTKVGRKYLYLRSEVLAWLKDQRGGEVQLTMPLEFPIEGGRG